MRAEVLTFTVSILLNASAIGAFDRAVYRYNSSSDAEKIQREALQKTGELKFNFVEAPAKPVLQAPLRSYKISDRDSVASDRTAAKELAQPGAPPKIEREAPADQLEQHRLDPKSSASAASPLSVPQHQTSYQPPQTPDSSAIVPNATPSKPEPASPASPASASQKVSEGQGGRDRISTPAASRSRSHGAQVYGTTSFDATGAGMGRYMRNLKERIWLAWFPYLAFHYPVDFRAADAVIEFTLDAGGQVKSVKIVSSEGSGLFAAFCVDAVQRAAPFGPLPPEVLDLMGRDQLDVQFAFHFW